MRIGYLLPLSTLALGLIIACGGSSGGDNPTPTHGVPDATFGINGVVTTSINGIDDEANALMIQGDGKLVVVAQTAVSAGVNRFAVVRYKSDGSLDTSFGAGGIVTTAIGTGDALPYAGAIQGDGKIVAAGYATLGTDKQFALVRYNTDGSLDSSFGNSGIVTTTLPNNDNEVLELGLQGDGKLLAGGYSADSQTMAYKVAMARYGTDGTLDPTYGTGGIVTSSWGPGGSWVTAFVIQGDGKAVVTGLSLDSNYKWQFALARYNTDGIMDTTFGSDGLQVTPMGTVSDVAYALGMQTDGKCVVGGFTNTGANNGNPMSAPSNLALARYSTTGSLDATFGSGGKVVKPFGSAGYSRINRLAIDASGNIVISGACGTDWSSRQGTLARFTPTGAFDTTFGSGGWTTNPLGEYCSGIWRIAIQGDGMLVGAGFAAGSGGSKIILVRYKP